MRIRIATLNIATSDDVHTAHYLFLTIGNTTACRHQRP